jgi:diacylglycerol kinase family enzyme
MSASPPPVRGGWTIVANAAAGSAEQQAVTAAAGVLESAGSVEVRWNTDLDDLEDVLSAGDRRLVVAGGDGTLHAVINRLARARPGGLVDLPIGILPLGTGNDLARGLGLPLDPVEAAGRIVGGAATPLPVLIGPGGELILNNAHWGIGVQAARRAVDLKPRLGRFAYWAGALDAGVRPGTLRAVVEVDGSEVFAGPAVAVLVAIGPSAGGGVTVAEDIELTEAVAHTVVVTAVGAWRRLRLAVAAARGGLSDAPDAVVLRGREVVVRTDGPGEAEADGEFRTWPIDASFTVRPAGWSVWR